MAHSWPGHHTHHLIFPDQHLPRAFEAPERICPTFVQDPAIEGFSTWIVWFLPERWESWEEAFRPHYVKEKCLRGGCDKCT
jgi:hypothetical protein